MPSLPRPPAPPAHPLPNDKIPPDSLHGERLDQLRSPDEETEAPRARHWLTSGWRRGPGRQLTRRMRPRRTAKTPVQFLSSCRAASTGAGSTLTSRSPARHTPAPRPTPARAPSSQTGDARRGSPQGRGKATDGEDPGGPDESLSREGTFVLVTQWE